MPGAEHRIRTGMGVVYMSGQQCGRVGAVNQHRFEVILGDGRRSWLPWDAAFTVDVRVTLICEAQGLAALVIQ